MAKKLLDETLATSLRVSADVTNTIIMVGDREHDRFCVSNDNSECPQIISLEQLVHNALNVDATWVYQPVHNKIMLSKLKDEISTPLPNQLAETKESSLSNALEQFKSLPAADNSKYCLIIDTSLLFENVTNPEGTEFQLLRLLDDHARNAGRHRVVILRAARLSLLPSSLVTNNHIRSIYIGLANQDTRYAYANVRSTRLAEKLNMPLTIVSSCIARASEDWSLGAIDRLIEVAFSLPEVKTLTDIEEMANNHRLGVTHNPWLGQQLRTQIRNCEAILSARVKGQKHAISAVSVVLKKAATGLAGSHEGKKSRVPRASLLLAGPTGTGKTEVAKSLAELIFGDQKNIIRFDCAEFRQDHSVSRLIGAPPGYVGYETGGELTEAIRKKPNSVVLFDEIEKAHPRIWDIFLSILSDGRLTNGSGQVSDFSQSIILFTSNLGIYSRQLDVDGNEIRTANFDMKTPYTTINLKVRQAIKDEFVSRLGRPEILGRLGGEMSENIIVFDYLRDIESVIQKFTTNICSVTKQLHNLQLIISRPLNDAMVQAIAADPALLLMGGRGVATIVEKMLTNPLAEYLFELDLEIQPSTVLVSYDADKTSFRFQ